MIGSLLGGLIQGGMSWLGAKEQQHQSDRVAWWTANQIKKAGTKFEDDFQAIIDSIAADPAGFAGQRVMPAMYEQTSLDQSLQDVLGANAGNFSGIADLISMANRQTTTGDMGRFETMAPGGGQALGAGMQNALSLMQGQIPQDVRDEVFSRRAESALGMGTPGGSAPLVARDLGLTSMEMMNQGTGLFGSLVQAAEQISPVNRQMAPAQMMFQPGAGASMNLEQAQLNQNSQQNANNLMAAPDPALAMIAQLQATQAMTQAGISANMPLAAPQSITPYAQIYGQIGGAINSALNPPQQYGGYSPYSSPSAYGGSNIPRAIPVY